MTDFNPPQSQSVISKQTIGSLSRRIKDVNETTMLSSGEQTLVLGSASSIGKKSKTNNLTHQLQMLSMEHSAPVRQKHIKIKHNLSSSHRNSEHADKNDQKTTKSDAEKSISKPAYASIINNNIQGLSINYSGHIMPPLPGQVVIDMSK